MPEESLGLSDTINIAGQKVPVWVLPVTVGGIIGAIYFWRSSKGSVNTSMYPVSANPSGLLPVGPSSSVGSGGNVPAMGGDHGITGNGPVGGASLTTPSIATPIVAPTIGLPAVSSSQPSIPFIGALAPGNVRTSAGVTAPGYLTGVIGYDVRNNAPIYSGGGQVAGGYLPRTTTNSPVLSGALSGSDDNPIGGN